MRIQRFPVLGFERVVRCRWLRLMVFLASGADGICASSYDFRSISQFRILRGAEPTLFRCLTLRIQPR